MSNDFVFMMMMMMPTMILMKYLAPEEATLCVMPLPQLVLMRARQEKPR
jgi:hypothetical protein